MLQTEFYRVKKIALFWIIIHILLCGVLFLAYVISSPERFWSEESKGIIGISAVMTLRLTTNSCLFIGAKQQIRLLLIPFMLLVVLDLVLLHLFGILVVMMLVTIAGVIIDLIEGDLQTYGLPPFPVSLLVLLFAIGTTVCYYYFVIGGFRWMLRSTIKLYTELRKANRVIGNRVMESHNTYEQVYEANLVPVDTLNDLNERHLIVDLPHLYQSNISSSVPNAQPLHYNETCSTPNANQCDMAIIAIDKPPQYSEATATPNNGDEDPPAYNEAMAMNNQKS